MGKIRLALVLFLFMSCSNWNSNDSVFVCNKVLLLSQGDPVMLVNRIVGRVDKIDINEENMTFHVKWVRGVKFIIPMKFQIVSREGQDEHSYVSLIPERIPGKVFREKYPPATEGWMCLQEDHCFIRNMQPAVIDIDTAYFLVKGEAPWIRKGIGVAVISEDELSRRSNLIGVNAVKVNDGK